MNKISHDNLVFCEKSSPEGKQALKKIKKFNFIKDKASYLLMDSSIIDKAHFAICDDQPYLFLHFLDMNTLRDTRILIGAYDVLTDDEGFGWDYGNDAQLTSAWRTIMLTQYPEYRDSLINILTERKNQVCKSIDDEINEIKGM